MQLAEGLAVRRPDDVGHDEFLASHVTLNIGQHVHLLKQDEALPALAKRLHGFVLLDGFRQAGNEERRERQGLPSFCFVLPQVSARPGHIDFEQAMDHGLAFDRRIHDPQYAPDL